MPHRDSFVLAHDVSHRGSTALAHAVPRGISIDLARPRRVWVHRLATCAALAILAPAALSAQTKRVPESPARYRATTNKLIDGALADTTGFIRLAELVDTHGHRLSGSQSLETAIDWLEAKLKADGLDNVHTEPVMVPHWVRGAESVELIEPRRTSMKMLGLGGSVGTPAGGITAPVVVISSFDELAKRAAEVRGKIVLFDVPFTNYGATVAYRALGPSAAAKVGAVAMLLRSVGPFSIASPHTGGLRYDTTVTKIPAAAITSEDAGMLHRLQARGLPVSVKLVMNAQLLPDAPSRNVIAQITGREKPDEVVVLGGHIDSWDVGQGAMDDGGGVVAAWEVLRLMKRLGIRPRRTIRLVAWTNEENGLRGGLGYAKAHEADLSKHVLAIESDGGVFKPVGFEVGASDAAYKVIAQIAPLLDRIGAGSLHRAAGSPGADITPLVEYGVPGLEVDVGESRYFWYHHTDGDTMDKLTSREFTLCVAAMAVAAYVAGELPEMLAKGKPLAGAGRKGPATK